MHTILAFAFLAFAPSAQPTTAPQAQTDARFALAQAAFADFQPDDAPPTQIKIEARDGGFRAIRSDGAVYAIDFSGSSAIALLAQNADGSFTIIAS